MKKFLSYLLSMAIVVVGLVGLVSCKEEQPQTTETKRMTIDINPSIEFILDKDDNVVSVTGLNDDGDLLVSGEVFVGKTADEAAEFVVELATQSGYIVKGNVSADKNNVKISISGYEEEVDALYKKVSGKVKSFLDESGIKANLEKVEAMKEDALKKVVAKCYPELTEEEINAMDNEQLLEKLKQSRVECAKLSNEALRETYYKMKSYQFKLASYEKTAELIAGLDQTYQSMITLYNQALENYQDAIKAIEQAQYDYFVDSESEYQQALSNLHDKKAEILELEKSLAEADSLTKIALEAQLTAAKLEYETASAMLTSVKQIADTAISGLINTMKSFETTLKELRNQFPDEIESVIKDKAEEIDKAMNDAKDKAFEEFEKEFGEEMTRHENELKKRKEDLIAKHGPKHDHQ